MAKDVVGPDAKAKAAALKDGEVLMLENVRFHAEETKNDPDFAKALASMAEIMSTMHSAPHTVHMLPQQALQITSRLSAATSSRRRFPSWAARSSNPKRPFVAILGGAKVSDKIGVISNLLEKVDTLIIGGGMAYTFFKAQGYEIGTTLRGRPRSTAARK